MKDREIVIWTCKDKKSIFQRNLVLGLDALNRSMYLQFRHSNGKYRSIYLAYIDFSVRETLQQIPEVSENDLRWVLGEDYKHFDRVDYLREQVRKMHDKVVEEYAKKHGVSKMINDESALSEERR